MDTFIEPNAIEEYVYRIRRQTLQYLDEMIEDAIPLGDPKKELEDAANMDSCPLCRLPFFSKRKKM